MLASNLSEYELKRKLNMEENQNLLQQLGLTSKEGITTDIPAVEPVSKKVRTKTYNRVSKPKLPTRSSRRSRGESPEDFSELSEIVDDNDRIRQLEVIEKRKEEEQTQILNLPEEIYVPVTLRSIGTTIWALGELNTGKGRSRAWSSRGCKYKHPYPIGYRATKSHFGNDYTMGISEGEDGPVFTVRHKAVTWSGNTPTAPWTEACIKSKSSSTRVSGPLFYGFSDPITMRLIENMEGYKQSGLSE
ncbi:hypothetical protein HPULCUR_010140 [Helicostylum pulchrum]|uniref:Uncharacterized protein n=1 Tax=Helicostylum pulchrum TaxID=562976 RepID=A0ABP9YDG3_9FUNG